MKKQQMIDEIEREEQRSKRNRKIFFGIFYLILGLTSLFFLDGGERIVSGFLFGYGLRGLLWS